MNVSIFTVMDMEKDAKSVKRITLIIASLTSFIAPFIGSSINIALPAIGKTFNMDAVLLGWVQTSYFLTSAILLVPFGRFADIYGRKKIYLSGTVVYILSSIFCAISPNATLFIISRVLQGIGASMIFGTAMAILTSIYPKEERGKALGINVATVYLGLSGGPFFGGILTQHFGWQSIFWFTIILTLPTPILIIWKLRGEWQEAAGEPFDIRGSLIYITMIFSLMFGLTLIPEKMGILLVFAGLALLFIFVLFERRIKYPAFDINLLISNGTYAFSNLAALINYSAVSSSGFLLSLYLQYIKGFSPRVAGTILVLQPVIMAILSPFAGKLSDRVEPRILSSLGMGLSFIGLVLLIFLSRESTLSVIFFSLAIFGVGFALFSSPNTNAVMTSISKKYYGVASSTLGTMRLVGHMFSMAIVTCLFSFFIGRTKINPESFDSFLVCAKIAFSIFSILCFFGIFASLFRGNVRENNNS